MTFQEFAERERLFTRVLPAVIQKAPDGTSIEVIVKRAVQITTVAAEAMRVWREDAADGVEWSMPKTALRAAAKTKLRAAETQAEGDITS